MRVDVCTMEELLVTDPNNILFEDLEEEDFEVEEHGRVGLECSYTKVWYPGEEIEEQLSFRYTRFTVAKNGVSVNIYRLTRWGEVGEWVADELCEHGDFMSTKEISSKDLEEELRRIIEGYIEMDGEVVTESIKYEGE